MCIHDSLFHGICRRCFAYKGHIELCTLWQVCYTFSKARNLLNIQEVGWGGGGVGGGGGS